ncbi:MFS transporter [Dehalococcoides mccartyi]|uniref:MFS transporter n=1 Tax=Dehalococcoides mccartyi TaxID=61435 RepID=UPI002FC9247B
MRLQTIFQPKATLSRDEVRHGLRALTWEGIATTGFSSVTTSAFLVAFALALGASNFQIGVLASIPFITDLLQIPAVWLVEKLRRRKIIVFVTWLISLLLWIPIALIPVIMEIPSAGAISMLLGLMAVRGILNALTNCSWSSWMRDLVPQQILGRYFARRLSLATAVAVVLGLSAAFLLDHWNTVGIGALGYSLVLLAGLIFFGLASPVFTAFIPELKMPAIAGPQSSFTQTIATPLRERNYRQLMKFLAFWGFASNLAIPFFAVFMLQQLGLSIFTVIVLTTVSEVFIVISLRFWGPLADRFGSKTVLSLSTSLYLLVILGWTLTSITGRHVVLLPILGILHVFAGIAVAGITLTVGTLSLKLAPQGRATPYLAGASLADSAGTGLGALAGGFLADFFARRSLVLDLSWASPFQSMKLDVIQLTGFHFLFALACLLGLITLRTLQAVHEKGAARREVVLETLMTETRTAFRQVNPVLELNFLSMFPFSYLRRMPGIDIAIGVTSYHLADMVRLAKKIFSRAMHGLQKKPPSREMENDLSRVLRTGGNDFEYS